MHMHMHMPMHIGMHMAMARAVWLVKRDCIGADDGGTWADVSNGPLRSVTDGRGGGGDPH